VLERQLESSRLGVHLERLSRARWWSPSRSARRRSPFRCWWTARGTRSGRAAQTLASLAAWRAAHPALDVLLVRGNHDRHAGDPPPELRIRAVDEPLTAAPFVLAHHPRRSPAGYVLAGHLHPAVKLRGIGRQREVLPCFHFGPEVGVLPSFGDFTGAARIVPAEGDRVFVVAGAEVLAV
jgi:uncharacterized protein